MGWDRGKVLEAFRDPPAEARWVPVAAGVALLTMLHGVEHLQRPVLTALGYEGLRPLDLSLAGLLVVVFVLGFWRGFLALALSSFITVPLSFYRLFVSTGHVPSWGSAGSELLMAPVFLVAMGFVLWLAAHLHERLREGSDPRLLPRLVVGALLLVAGLPLVAGLLHQMGPALWPDGPRYGFVGDPPWRFLVALVGLSLLPIPWVRARGRAEFDAFLGRVAVGVVVFLGVDLLLDRSLGAVQAVLFVPEGTGRWDWFVFASGAQWLPMRLVTATGSTLLASVLAALATGAVVPPGEPSTRPDTRMKPAPSAPRAEP